MTEPIDTRTVGDSMTREVYGVAPDTSIETAARLFAARHITGAPVIDDQGKVIGVVTQSDLVDPDRNRTEHTGKSLFYRITEAETEPFGFDDFEAEGQVADVMSPFVLSVAPEAPLRMAAKLMVAEHVHRLLVIDANRLVGILSSMDVLRTLAAGPR